MQVPIWQRHIIAYIKSNPLLSLQLVVLNTNPRSSRGHLVYKAFRKIDRKLFTTRHDCFTRVSLDEVLKGTEVMQVTPMCTSYSDQIKAEEVSLIAGKKLDVLIRFGFRILKGDVLQAARYGVWSLHHGDNAINRGGPPAFWEVVNREAVTGVTLQTLSSDLDGGTVIDKAFIKTDQTSFHRNQNALYWAGIELLCNALTNLAAGRKTFSKHQEQGSRFYSKPLYRNPGNGRALAIFFSFWMRRIGEVLRSLIKKQQWSLYYKYNPGGLETSLFRYKRLTPPPATDWADPFVVWRDHHYYIFFEEFAHRHKKAHISYMKFNEAGSLISEKPTPVLVEPHHLSYPFLIEQDGTYYMVPEAGAGNNVWLYRCEQFPDRWMKHKHLLKDIALYDPTILFHENRWYLFGTQKPLPGSSPDQYLYIYYSDDLISEAWQVHPQSPVTRDVRGARPAGKIFEHNGKLMRPSQIGAPKYGYGIRLNEIIKLTPDEFEERPVDDILPEWKEGLLATHTMNVVRGFAVVDVQSSSFQ